MNKLVLSGCCMFARLNLQRCSALGKENKKEGETISGKDSWGVDTSPHLSAVTHSLLCHMGYIKIKMSMYNHRLYFLLYFDFSLLLLLLATGWN